jgi:outer membrane protein
MGSAAPRAMRDSKDLRVGYPVLSFGIGGVRRFLGASLLVFVTAVPVEVRAESLVDALAAAYANNPELNAARAELRAIDENVPLAKSGLRPRIAAGAEVGAVHRHVDPERGPEMSETTRSGQLALTLTQPVFQGFRVRNGIRQAQAQVLSGRAALLSAEQNLLLDGVQTYMDVVRDAAIIRLNRQNLDVLQEQLRSARERFEVGEVTRTDVAQAEAATAEARSVLQGAEGALRTAEATYEQIIGSPPRNLRFPQAFGFGMARSLPEALDIAVREHPAVEAAQLAAEAAEYQIKIAEGELLPSVSVEASAQQRWDQGQLTQQSRSLSIFGRVTIPIYQQGAVSARVRQAKQIRTQRKLEEDAIRREVRAAVASTWAGLQTAVGQIASDEAQIRAARLALEGVREEERVGQRTTLDVLNAQQELLAAQVNLTASQRDRVVAAYALLAATGQLNAARLGLPVPRYDPSVNYREVEDKWFGLRTPGGQ